jgi:hypothetical protein
MGKSKSASKSRTPYLPQAPWLYVNNTTSDGLFGDQIVGNLMSLIPKSDIALPKEIDHYHPDACWVPLVNSPDDTIVIFVDRQLDLSRAVQTANSRRENAIELGKNLTSVNLTNNSSVADHENKLDWGTNHLEVNTTHLTARAAAEKIFKWLCKLHLLREALGHTTLASTHVSGPCLPCRTVKVLTVPETLHLIPEADMRAVDDKNFPDYAYCPINQSRKHRKDAKIQFVALIVSKPEVGPDKRLQWKVVDRTGEVCTTIFLHRIISKFLL